MPLALTEILTRLPAFALVLFRLSGLMMTAPLYSGRAVPARVRAAMTLALAAMIFPLVSRQVAPQTTLAAVLVGGVGELMIGAVIGLCVTILLMGADVAGELVSQQAGVSLGEVVNPLFEAPVSVISQAYAIVVTLFFLLAGGHRAVIAALLDTYEVIPVLSYQPGESIVLLLLEMLSAAFMFGVRLAAPALIALFLSGTALALLSRTMPQLNILSVGFTLRALVMLGLAAVTLGSCQGMLLEALTDGLDVIRAGFGLGPSLWSPTG